MATIVELEKALKLVEPYEAEQIRKEALEAKGLKEASLVEDYLTKFEPAKTKYLLSMMLKRAEAEKNNELIEAINGIQALIQDLVDSQSDCENYIQHQYENELSYLKQTKHN